MILNINDGIIHFIKMMEVINEALVVWNSFFNELIHFYIIISIF